LLVAFVVAWGGLSAQSARLVGLIILILELKQFGIKRWETALFWVYLLVGIGVSPLQYSHIHVLTIS